MGSSDDTHMAFSALKYTHTSIFELFIQCVCVYGMKEINMTYTYIQKCIGVLKDY